MRQCHGPTRKDTTARCFSRCGVPPGRNVERENRCAARVRPFDKAHSLTNRRGFQTVTYECVQDDVGVLSVKLGASDLLSRSGLEHLVLESGDFSQMFRVSKAYTDAAAVIGEMSACTDAPPPLPPLPASTR